eukprot:11067196-Alexandrium_andersonii.AAC.1
MHRLPRDSQCISTRANLLLERARVTMKEEAEEDMGEQHCFLKYISHSVSYFSASVRNPNDRILPARGGVGAAS